MALELTARARILANQTEKSPQLILDIPGYGTFGALTVTRIANYGDAVSYGDSGFYYGGVTADPTAYDYINLGASSGGASPITQQLFQDKGGSGSVSTVTIELVDKNELMTQLLSPGVLITDLLGRKAKVFLNFEGGAHPEDSVQIFNGIVNDIESGAGAVRLTIGAPETLKRQDLFVKATTKLNGALNNSDTTITVDDTSDFLLPADSGTLTTYFRIDDEIIQYTGVTATTFTGCTRGALGTTAATHDDNTETESVYRLQGTMMDLALKLMLSAADDPSITGVTVASFVQIDSTTSVANAILFTEDMEKTYGLVVGDYITIAGATNGANNFTERTIVSFTDTDLGQYIVVSGAALVTEATTSATASFKSKYDVLPEGLGMPPDQVDVARHEDLDTQFGASFFSYDFSLTDQVKGSDFINTQLYFPSGCYQLTRQGRASIGITLPPIAETDTKVLNSSNILNPAKIKISRSVNKNFYNAVVYKFDPYVLDGRFLQGRIFQSADSTSRISTVGNKVLTVEAQGIRQSGTNENIIRLQSRRFLDRYQFGAETLKIEVKFGDGFNIEVGDAVIFGDTSLKLSDSKYGTREFQPRLMEVTNKSMKITTGDIQLELTDTAFSLDGRYGVIGPSSILGSGSTTTRLKLTNSFGNVDGAEVENFKWEPYEGQNIIVRSYDWTTIYETVLTGFDATDPTIMIVSPALSGAPPAGYIVDVPRYPTGTVATTNAIWKAVHCFWTPQIAVTAGASQTVFSVGAGDVSKLFVGSIVRIHDATYARDSEETVVTDITGTSITVRDALGFTPASGDFVELVGFTDEGLPYRWI